MTVLEDVIVSDHKPVSCYLQCSVLVNKCSSAENLEHSSRVPHWSACNDNTCYNYEMYLDNALKMVDIPVEVVTVVLMRMYVNPELMSFTVKLLIVLS